jgi:uroporphyrinogen decarboxylase
MDFIDHPDLVRELIEVTLSHDIRAMQRLVQAGVDVVIFGDDYADKNGPLMSPRHFKEFILPGLKRCVDAAHKAGAYVIKHTDGNIMPILDDYLSLGAACFQSVDPMAGMDIAEVKRRCHGKLALMGNVQCSLLQDGPREAIRQSALYCLENAAPGGGYIFGTSNTIFPGMPLANYEYMLEVYRGFCAARSPVRR